MVLSTNTASTRPVFGGLVWNFGARSRFRLGSRHLFRRHCFQDCSILQINTLYLQELGNEQRHAQEHHEGVR
jgi:hypothetical protein